MFVVPGTCSVSQRRSRIQQGIQWMPTTNHHNQKPQALPPTDPPDIFKPRRLYSLALPDAKRADRALVLCRNRTSVVA